MLVLSGKRIWSQLLPRAFVCHNNLYCFIREQPSRGQL